MLSLSALHLPLPSCSLNYPWIIRKKNQNNKAVWKLTSPIVTKCPPQQTAESETTAPTWTAAKPHCACLNPRETWSKVARRNFSPIFLALTGQDRKESESVEREGEKEQQAGPELARSLQRPTVLSIQVPLISLDSQTQAPAGAGETAKNRKS